jgi:hypothetical protein
MHFVFCIFFKFNGNNYISFLRLLQGQLHLRGQRGGRQGLLAAVEINVTVTTLNVGGNFIGAQGAQLPKWERSFSTTSGGY